MEVAWYFAITSVITICVAWYLRTYIAEQAKSLATREHIEDITRKIESVKIEYQKEIEVLKAEYAKQNIYLESHLNLSNQVDAAREEFKRNALVQFYEDCAIMTHQNLHVNLQGMGFDEKFAHVYGQEMKESFAKIATSYFRVCLYEQAGELIWKAAGEVIKASGELECAFSKAYPTFFVEHAKRAKYLEDVETNLSESLIHVLSQYSIACDNYNNEMKPYIENWNKRFRQLVLSVNLIHGN